MKYFVYIFISFLLWNSFAEDENPRVVENIPSDIDFREEILDFIIGLKEKQNVIYGNDDSYLNKILNAQFDGVYLDIISAYEFFEK